MRLKATFTIELEADDFVAAADLQRELEQTLGGLRQQFPQAELRLTERRLREQGPGRRNARGPGITGRLNAYRDD